jgi:hypothetical protein
MIFFYDLAMIAILMVIAFLYVQTGHFEHFGRSISYLSFLKFHDDKYRQLFNCMWMGALGGLTISLKGVYDHSHPLDPWKDSYNLWHIGRPLSGAIAGLMVAVLFILFVPNVMPLVLYGVAFIFGTQDAAFFDFLSTFAGRFLPKGSQTDGSTVGVRISAVSPPQAGPGAAMTIQGQGFEGDATVKVGSEPIEHPTFAADGTAVTGHIPTIQGIAPGQTKVLDVIVANKNGSSAALVGKFTYVQPAATPPPPGH